MKKTALIFSFLMINIFLAVGVRAEDSMPTSQNDNEMQGGERGMEKMKGGMGKGMMHHQPSVVATSDGGIVILDGPRLLKYDSQLKLIGEAELKPGKKGPKMKKDGEMSPAEEAPIMDEPAVELPSVENPS